MYMCVEARGQREVSSSGTQFTSFQTGSLIGLEITNKTRLARQLAPVILVHPDHWGYNHVPLYSFLKNMYLWGFF